MQLYAVADQYVYGKNAKEVAAITADLPKQKSLLEKQLEKYKQRKNFKAYAVAI